MAGEWSARLAREIGSAGRLFILGVGNEDRADDVAGSLAARRLLRALRARPASDANPGTAPGRAGSEAPPPAVRVLDGGGSPENATGLIRRFRPALVLIIDAAAGGRRPGEVFFVEEKDIADDELTTHRIPLSRLVRYLEESIGCRVLLLGIEPVRLSGGAQMSEEVKDAVDAVVAAIKKAIRE